MVGRLKIINDHFHIGIDIIYLGWVQSLASARPLPTSLNEPTDLGRFTHVTKGHGKR